MDDIGREILFRAKRLDNGEWVIGSLFIPDLKDRPTQICIGTDTVRITYDVDPTTVGQYTGLTDKNGVKIFEGDVIKGFKYRDYGQSGEYQDDVRIVKWREKDAGFYPFTMFDSYTFNLKHYAVIGNRWDNQELL